MAVSAATFPPTGEVIVMVPVSAAACAGAGNPASTVAVAAAALKMVAKARFRQVRWSNIRVGPLWCGACPCKGCGTHYACGPKVTL
ncbi:hypothetical protein GCM10010399_15910 [Dactylosporangium fulvum]